MPTTSVPALFRWYGLPACVFADATATVTANAAMAATVAVRPSHLPCFFTTCLPWFGCPLCSGPSLKRFEPQHHRLESSLLPERKRLRDTSGRRRRERFLDRA